MEDSGCHDVPRPAGRWSDYLPSHNVFIFPFFFGQRETDNDPWIAVWQRGGLHRLHFQAEGYGTEGFVATASQTPEAQTADLKPVGSRCKWMFGQVIAYITSCEHKQLYCTGFCKSFCRYKKYATTFFSFCKATFQDFRVSSSTSQAYSSGR